MMGEDGQIHRVICKHCKKELQEGINPPIFKLCPECIPKVYPAAPGGLRDANGKRIGEVKPKETRIRIETELYTLEPEDKEKETIIQILFRVEDYFKNPLIEFTADYKQVSEWYEEMKKLDVKYNK